MITKGANKLMECCEVMMLTMLPRSRHGEEIPEPVAQAMKNSGGMTANYNRINEIAIDLNKRLESARKIRVVTDSGTDITFGGDVIAVIHLDGIIKEPHLYVDGDNFILSFDN